MFVIKFFIFKKMSLIIHSGDSCFAKFIQFFIEILPNENIIFQNNSKWFLFIPSDSYEFIMIPSISYLLLVIPSDAYDFLMIPNDSYWFLRIPRSS